MTVGHSRFATIIDGVYESLILRTQEQLIKSYSPRLFMPVTLFRLVLFDKGFVANDTIRYRITPSKCDHFVTIHSFNFPPANPGNRPSLGLCISFRDR